LPGRVLPAGRFGGLSSDPADTKFLHCAQAGLADYIVTGNKRDFPDASYGPTLYNRISR
jgi:hypothetical protein